MMKANMKKVLTAVIGTSLVFTAGAPFNVVLADEVVSATNAENRIDSEEIVITQENKNTYSIFDKNSDESDVVQFNNDYTSATILNDDGTVDFLTKDSAGNIYLNGEMYAEKVYEPENNDSQPRMLLKASNGYQYVTTYKTKQSVYRNTAAIGASLAGLIGGPVGYFLTAAGIIEGFRNYSIREVYVKITQYYNKYTHMVQNKMSFYKKSNYTDLIRTYTETHRLFS